MVVIWLMMKEDDTKVWGHIRALVLGEKLGVSMYILMRSWSTK